MMPVSLTLAGMGTSMKPLPFAVALNMVGRATATLTWLGEMNISQVRGVDFDDNENLVKRRNLRLGFKIVRK